MPKVYLTPDQEFTLQGAKARLGGTATSTDMQLMLQNDGSDGVGTILADGFWDYDKTRSNQTRLTFTVFLDEQTGQFFYYDDCGY
jgi:hypothetical protein